MDLTLRSFRFKGYDYPKTECFYSKFLQMNLDQHFITSHKVVMALKYDEDDVCLRFEFPQIPHATTLDADGVREASLYARATAPLFSPLSLCSPTEHR
jgi:hypothetical protein